MLPDSSNGGEGGSPFPDYRTISEAADVLRVNSDTIRRAIQRGALRAEKAFGVWLIPIADVEEALCQGVGSAGAPGVEAWRRVVAARS